MTTDVELWRRAEQVFAAALDSSAEERDALIRTACAGHPALKYAVEALLAAHERPVFLDAPLLRAAVPIEVESLARISIGPYRLVRLIGEGGMSSVFLAERAEGDFQQIVAIKLIRDGRVGPATVRRFRRERRILAALQHPNIARLLDGGTTEDGVSYVVMEYIQGVPITQYCDARRSSIQERLELFRSVCEAVQHAHASLVIHRDIKPTNILVTDDGVPKLLDFGIATQLGPRRPGVTDEPTSTREGALTPEYASPEQLAGAPLTTATDIYSLGVLLHELLVGQRPARPPVANGTVRDADVDPPSVAMADARGGAIGDALEAMAAARGVTPRQLRRQVSGDLDNIARRALSVDPSRRYASVEQFSGDVACHLTGRPVTARPPSFVYRTRKFVRRNALAVALGSSAIVGVAAVAGVLVHEDARVRRERDAALHESQRADRERLRAEEVTRFLVESFEKADPYKTGRQTVSAREVLDLSAERLRRSSDGDPALRSTLLNTIGRVYRSLGLYDAARPLLEEALTLRRRAHGEVSREVAETLVEVGLLRHRTGDVPAAQALFRRALEMRRQLLGDQHVDVAYTLTLLGDSLSRRGEYAEAEPMLREALHVQRQHFGEDHVEVATTLSRLAWLVRSKGDLDQAEALYREALSIFRKGGSEDHPVAATAYADLAWTLNEKGDFAGAEPLYQQALAIRRRVYGERHPDVGATLNAFAVMLRDKGDYSAAEQRSREALDLCQSLLSPAHPNCSRTLATLASIVMEKGDASAAEALAEQAATALRRALGPDNVVLCSPLYVLAAARLERGRLRGAQQAIEEALSLRRRQDPRGNATDLAALADIKRSMGHPREALALAAEAVDLLSRETHPDPWDTAVARGVLADCLVAHGRLEEARPMVLESLAAARKAQPRGGYALRRALQSVARYETAGGALPPIAAAQRADARN